MGTISSPIDNQRFSDAEQHDGNLGDGEKTPNRGLFHEIGGEDPGKIGTEGEEKDALNDHPFLLVEGEERSEHHKGVDGCSWNDVSCVSQRHRPCKMIFSSVRTNFVSSQPLSRWARKGLFPNSRQKIPSKQHSSADEAKSFDDLIPVKIS